MGTERTVLYLRVETAQALAGYGLRHASRFRSRSAAADHLLRRALMGELDEGMEGVLAPALVRAVRETVRREIADQTGPLIERQSQRLAGLLVQSGKDAHRAARIAEVALGRIDRSCGTPPRRSIGMLAAAMDAASARRARCRRDFTVPTRTLSSMAISRSVSSA